MAKRFYLHFTLRNEPEPLIFEVREAESDRLGRNLAAATDESLVARFFWFESLDGRSVTVNLGDLQVARFLWEPSEAPSDLRRHEGGLEIKLRGQEQLLEAFPDEFEQVLGMFESLEMGYSEFVQFNDEDGELVMARASEIVWATYPIELLNEVRDE